MYTGVLSITHTCLYIWHWYELDLQSDCCSIQWDWTNHIFWKHGGNEIWGTVNKWRISNKALIPNVEFAFFFNDLYVVHSDYFYTFISLMNWASNYTLRSRLLRGNHNLYMYFLWNHQCLTLVPNLIWEPFDLLWCMVWLFSASFKKLFLYTFVVSFSFLFEM